MTYDDFLEEQAAEEIIHDVTMAMGLYFNGEQFVYAWYPGGKFNLYVLNRLVDYYSETFAIRHVVGQDAIAFLRKAWLKKKPKNSCGHINVLVFSLKE